MQIPNDAITDTITLRHKEIKISTCSLPQKELSFYAENPRIYSSVWVNDDTPPSQDEIFKVLSNLEHVRESLVPSIRANGGLLEPVLVRDGIVLEGNSRLAAYRLLAQKDQDKWESIRARVLPLETSESEVFSLLGEYHMVGKKDWAPFEQAGYLYRRFTKSNVGEKELAAEVGLTKTKVEHLVAVYRFMVEHHERDPKKWSFYDELLKGRRFDNARKIHPNFDELIAEKIATGEISNAMALRDELPNIVKIGGNTLKKFMSGSMDFLTAAEDARQRGAGNYHAQKLRIFKQWLNEEATERDVTAMSEQEFKAVKFDLEKIQSRIGQLLKKRQKQ